MQTILTAYVMTITLTDKTYRPNLEKITILLKVLGQYSPFDDIWDKMPHFASNVALVLMPATMFSRYHHVFHTLSHDFLPLTDIFTLFLSAYERQISCYFIYAGLFSLTSS